MKIIKNPLFWSGTKNQVSSEVPQEDLFNTSSVIRSNNKYSDSKNISVGEHTYGPIELIDPGESSISIGKFCSIASGVKFILGNHKQNISTYPFKIVGGWPGALGSNSNDHSTKGNITIGNDVWIGLNAVILSAVQIGDGCIIGANAVVTKSIPPYSIVAGNPATIKKYRFNDRQIQQLLKIKWWDWPDKIIDQYLPLILNDDVDSFILMSYNVNPVPTD